MRPGPHASPARFLPDSARGGRRRSAAHIPSHPGGEFPQAEAGDGHGHLRHGRGGGAHPWPHPGWMDHGRLQLALDILHQYPRGRAFSGAHLPADLRPALSGAPQTERGEDRLHWAGLAERRIGVSSDRARQGRAGGLVRLQLHHRLHGHGAGGLGRSDSLGGSTAKTRWWICVCSRTATSPSPPPPCS